MATKKAAPAKKSAPVSKAKAAPAAKKSAPVKAKVKAVVAKAKPVPAKKPVARKAAPKSLLTKIGDALEPITELPGAVKKALGGKTAKKKK